MGFLHEAWKDSRGGVRQLFKAVTWGDTPSMSSISDQGLSPLSILDNTLCEAMILDDTFEPLLSLSFPLSCNCLVTWGEIPLKAEVTRTVSSLPNFFNYGGLDSDKIV